MEKYGSFGGLDTCNNVELSNIKKHYILRFKNKDKTISNQYDGKNHLDVLRKHKTISSETVNSMRNKSQKSNAKLLLISIQRERLVFH